MIWDFDYGSVSAIARLLNENGLSMTKKFGQNFLVSQQVLDRIVSLCGDVSGMTVWEVGPGIGALTTKLLKAGANVTAFEIDHGFCRILREQAYVDNPSFRLIEGDALRNWKGLFEKEGAPDIVCANLPYNVGSIFIASLIEGRCIPQRMVYTLQSEVVRRMCSKVGSPDYSGFTVLTGIDYENSEALRIKAGCFFPPPNVDSSVVVMQRRSESLVPEACVGRLISLVRVLFSQRRKTVKNNMKGLGLGNDTIDALLLAADIPSSERAERLSMEQLVSLAAALEDLHAKGLCNGSNENDGNDGNNGSNENNGSNVNDEVPSTAEVGDQKEGLE